ncbi:(R)-mandelonitrile lyase [Thauera sp. SDU_THAU2]|uniref:(R)-mandelonitrile lyase n=1 Tax=Thauera sp. SDU_THAU2 TaxID=3136633 RepID=UPI0031202EAA
MIAARQDKRRRDARRPFSLVPKLVATALAGALLAGCMAMDFAEQAPAPKLSRKVVAEMAGKKMKPESPVLIRIFKQESELEVWKVDASGGYALFKSYPMCRWSGKLGPKMKSGDRQAPEGFYHVSARMLNPKSQYYVSFNLGYPNRLESALGYTGEALMVHGACSSSGCYAMTDQGVGEIYAIVQKALEGGQERFQVQAYPFRMTAANMARHRGDPSMPFWRTLKEGYDAFAFTKRQPKVSVCGSRYVFNRDFADGEPADPLAAWPRLDAARCRADGEDRDGAQEGGRSADGLRLRAGLGLCRRRHASELPQPAEAARRRPDGGQDFRHQISGEPPGGGACRSLHPLRLLIARESTVTFGGGRLHLPDRMTKGIDMDIFRAGSRASGKGPSDWFTGTVRIDPLFNPSAPERVQGASVTFEPGARTAWHTHPLGQTLVVTAGFGRVQRWDGPVEEIRPGDVVWFAPGEKHWHGAAPDVAMTHIAVQEVEDGKVVDWLEHVTDAQYGG